jgi:predicted esterase
MSTRPFKMIYTVLLGLLSLNAFAISKLPLPAEIFEVNGRNGFVMQSEKPAASNPWVWYAPTLNTYPHHSQQFYFEQLLEHGIAVAGYDLGEVRGAPESSATFTGFYEAMVAKGYSKKPILLGQSRGGLMMLCWAFRNPDKVGAFAGIYPVCNIASWPLQRSKPSVLADYGLSEEEIMKQLDTFNPPQNMAGLAEAGVPMFIIHGDSDRVVPYNDNSALIKAAYEPAGGEIEVKRVPGKGHAEVPEFFRDQDLLEFIFKHAKEKK